MKCVKYPVNIMENKSSNTIYIPGCYKKSFLINVPKILKFLFKKYEWSGGKGNKLEKNVCLPIILSKHVLSQHFLRRNSVKLD
jgi:hypothetical protein